MIVESIGGKCPNCDYTRCELRYNQRGTTGFQFQACPRCGFAYGTDGETDYWHSEVWVAIEIANKLSRKELFEKYKGAPIDPDINGSLFSIPEERVMAFRNLNYPVYGEVP